MGRKLKTYRFEYKEVNTGFIEVEAFSEDDAFDLAQCADGDVIITSSEWKIGDKLEN